MSLEIRKNVSLKNYNTFGIEVIAKYFVQIEKDEQLVELFSKEEFNNIPKLILGGGSNILFTQDFEGLIVFIDIQGIKYTFQDNQVRIESGAGVIWNDLVQYCVGKNFGGIENLSLIPGTVGAAPVQNIGAYGVELKDVFHSCIAFDTETKEFRTFERKDCKFGYRESLFKGEEKGRYIITSVSLNLSTSAVLNTSYGAIQLELNRREISAPTIQDVSKVVSDIRVSKLPDPSTIGNSGSFFKNPIIDCIEFEKIQSVFLDIVHYPVQPNKIKLAAGWLIEQCGWKGLRVGNTGTWKNQALVLVNNGNATGGEVYEFSQSIIDSVKDKFGVVLEREVNII